jgi:hypothetical protein
MTRPIILTPPPALAAIVAAVSAKHGVTLAK